MATDEQPPEVEEESQQEAPSEIQLERSTASHETVLEVPLVETTSEAPKPKPKARGKRGPDKAPRAKPKPKAARREAVLAPPVEIGSDSSESADEATLQEIHSLNLLRSIRAYESTKQARKQQLYASWFGR